MDKLLKTEQVIVKIGDFGTSKNLSDRTLAKTKIVTESYAAPEVYLYDEVDLPYDIWSLGVIFFRLITLRKPFSSDKEIIDVNYDRTQILDPELLFIIEQIFQLDPRQRPQIHHIIQMIIDKLGKLGVKIDFDDILRDIKN